MILTPDGHLCHATRREGRPEEALALAEDAAAELLTKAGPAFLTRSRGIAPANQRQPGQWATTTGAGYSSRWHLRAAAAPRPTKANNAISHIRDCRHSVMTEPHEFAREHRLAMQTPLLTI